MNIPAALKKHWAIALFLTLLAIFRFSLITKGHFFDADERRYLYALWFWQDILHGKFFAGFSCFFEVQGRPGFVLISLIPAGIQLLAIHLHLIKTLSLHLFDIPSFFNAAASLINSLLFYNILRILLADQFLSLTGTIIYSLLVNSNVYIRHLFPYDYSLLAFLTFLYLLVKQSPANPTRLAIICGLLSALGALIYPGYSCLILIILCFAFTSKRFDFKNLCFYIGSIFLILGGVEFLSETLRKSYLMECLILSDTVKHGNFSEGFLFLVRYLFHVEGLIGITLVTLFSIYIIFFSWRDQSDCPKLVMPAIMFYTLYALAGLLFLKVVFYGRLLHLYFPFLVIGAMRMIALITQKTLQRILAIIILIISLYSFAQYAEIYEKQIYPRDISQQYLGNIPNDKIYQLKSNDQTSPSTFDHYSAAVLNMKSYFAPAKKPSDPLIPNDFKLVADAAHPLNFTSYTFENYGPDDRKLLQEGKYRMKIYLRGDAVGASVTSETLSQYLFKTAQSQ